MTLEESILFPYLGKIKDPTIKEYVVKTFQHVPSYFWDLEASTGGKYHGGELLITHVQRCCQILVESVWKQTERVWDDKTRDISLAAMLLHDCWRCGYPGKENTGKGGKLYTSKDHAKVGGQMIREILGSSVEAEMIAQCVHYHYGPWGEDVDKYMTFKWVDPRCIIHTIDAHNAWNSNILLRS